MKSLSIFKIVFLGLFVVFIIGGVITFAMFSSSGKTPLLSETIIWGTVPADYFNAYVDKIKSTDKKSPLNVKYYEVKPENFTQILTENLANDSGPDAILIPSNLLYENESKVFPIPYTSYPERAFKDTYIQEAELYLLPSGVMAVPFFIDPLVMYWNRDIFTNKGLALSPKYWQEFLDLAKLVTKKDDSLNISQSAVSFGEFDNVNHAKEIISTLMMQAGVPITLRGPDGKAASALKGKAAASSLKFYTAFSDPTSAYYTWNRKLPNSKDLFISGGLATYFGFASELHDINLKNPNLNFDVSATPQLADTSLKATYGDLYGFSVLKRSKNLADTYASVILLSGADYLPMWLDLWGLPPARRDLLADKPIDPYKSVFYDSAIISRSWLEPSDKIGNGIFGELINTINSNAADVETALNTADTEMGQYLK